MRLAVTFPYITDDPSKAMIAVMDVCRQLPILACRLPTDACLNVAISVSFEQAVSVRSNTEISAGKLTYPISATTLHGAHALKRFESRKIEDRRSRVA